MKRVNRRTFLQWLSPGAAADPRAVTAPAPSVVPAVPSVGVRTQEAVATAGSLPSTASGFSLEAFYAARGPQNLPPIAIRPSVLHYAAELTNVGCPPAHQPPALEGDPLYARLAAEATCAPAADPNALPQRGHR
ncbi:MAG: hypothetical protein RL685_3196 [Pseudomonadota bacterium]|jgi:hypothetical protein